MQPEAEPMQRALIDAIRRPSAAQTIYMDMSSYLRSHGAGERDVRANSDPVSAERFLLYRSLVKNRIRGALDDSIPRTLARLGEERTAAALDGFLLERASRSHYLRDVASEFVHYCEQTWAADAAIPAYLIELACYELLLFEVPAAQDDPPCEAEPELALDEGARFQNAARLVRYTHAVHRLPDCVSDLTCPVEGDFALLAYRDSSGDMRCLELSAVAASLVQRLLAGEPLREAILGACSELGACADDATLGGIAAFLADLHERGALLT